MENPDAVLTGTLHYGPLPGPVTREPPYLQLTDEYGDVTEQSLETLFRPYRGQKIEVSIRIVGERTDPPTQFPTGKRRGSLT